MYSVLGLGVVMTADAFGVHVPHWLTPVLTFAILGYFLTERDVFSECDAP